MTSTTHHDDPPSELLSTYCVPHIILTAQSVLPYLILLTTPEYNYPPFRDEETEAQTG